MEGWRKAGEPVAWSCTAPAPPWGPEGCALKALSRDLFSQGWGLIQSIRWKPRRFWHLLFPLAPFFPSATSGLSLGNPSATQTEGEQWGTEGRAQAGLNRLIQSPLARQRRKPGPRREAIPCQQIHGCAETIVLSK